MSHDITLATHVNDVVEVFRNECLNDVILVGHSYGGWVISGAVENVRSQVSAIVFVDAHVPADGDTAITTSHHRKEIELALEEGRPSTPPPPAEWFKVNERDRTWVDQMLTPQPVGVYLQPIRLTGAREAVRNKAYVRAIDFKSERFEKNRDHARKNGWRTFGVRCGHDIMIDEPGKLATILCIMARPASATARS